MKVGVIDHEDIQFELITAEVVGRNCLKPWFSCMGEREKQGYKFLTV